MKAFNILITVILLFSFTACKKESSSTAKEPAWLNQDLLAYYPLDGNTKDSSGNGFDGVANSLLSTTNRKNKQNKAFDFRNRGYMATNLNSTHFANDFTVSLWMKLDSVISTDPHLFHSSYLGSSVKGNSIYFHIYGVANPNVAFINLKDWSHIAVTRKSDSSSLYLNGTYLSTIQHVKGQSLKPGNGMVFGREFYGNFPQYYDYNGKLDDIRIYKRALTAEEVKYLYQN